MKTRLGGLVRYLGKKGSSAARPRRWASRFLVDNLESRVLLDAFTHAGDANPTLNGTGTLLSPISGTANVDFQEFGFANYPQQIRTGFYPVPDASSTNYASLSRGWVTADLMTVSGGRPQLTVTKYNSDGSIDTTSGFNNGVVDLSSRAGDPSTIAAVLIRADGTIDIAGTWNGATTGLNNTNADAYIIQLKADGTLDNDPTTGFDAEGKVDGTAHDGVVLYDFARASEQIDSAVLAPDNSIIIAGEQQLDPTAFPPNGNTNAFPFMVRIKQNGSVDNTFGPDGRAIVDAAGSLFANFNILYTGLGGEPEVPEATGEASGSVYALQEGQKNLLYGGQFNAVTFTPNGKIVAVGSYNANLQTDTAFLIARFNADGTLDTTFNGTGYVLNNFTVGGGTLGGGEDMLQAVAVQTDGSIVVAGYSVPPNTLTFPLARRGRALATVLRYNADGTLDTTFNGTGSLSDQLTLGNDTVFTTIGLQYDGKIVVGGYGETSYGGESSMAIRLNPDGTYDNSFGVNGRAFLKVDTNTTTALWYLPNADYTANPIVPQAYGTYPAVDIPMDMSIDPNGAITLVGGSYLSDTTPNLTMPKVKVPPHQFPYLILGSHVTPDGVSVIRFTNDSPLFRSDTTRPTPELIASDITAATTGSYTYQFRILIADNYAVDPATYAGAQLNVDGPGFHGTATYVESRDINNQVVTTPQSRLYTVWQLASPLAGWQAQNNGQYTVSTAPGVIVDAYGNGVGAVNLGTFRVQINSADTTPPSAAMDQTVADFTAPATTNPQQIHFAVRYSDNTAVSVSSITGVTSRNQTIRITGPNGFSTFALLDTSGTHPLGVNNGVDGTPIVAYYFFTVPGWNASTYGQYSISIDSNKVFDTAGPPYAGGNPVPAGQLQRFTVTPTDVQAPSPASLSAPDVVLGSGANPYQFTVTFSDDVAIDPTTITSGIITITGPNNFTTQATLFNRPSAPAAVITATFQFTPPGGTWDVADLGTYTVSLAASSVMDTSGNAVPGGTLGSFIVKRPPDATNPTAAMQTPDWAAGATNQITVVFNDDVQVNAATVATGAVVLNGPGATNLVGTLVSKTSTNSNQTITAVFSFTKPGNALWSFLDNGLYTLTIGTNPVSDTTGNPVQTIATNTFTLTLQDNQPPTATLAATNITNPTTTPYQFQVTFADATGVDLSTVQTNDAIRVTGPSGYSQLATYVGMQGSAATYQVTPPNGTWDARAIGTYTVYVTAGHVADSSAAHNTYATDTAIGTFNVAVPDTLAPMVSMVAGDFSGLTNAVYTFQVQFTDGSGIMTSSINGNNRAVLVTGPMGYRSYATFVSFSATTMRATYRVLGPNSQWNVNAAGAYYVTVQANQIADTRGNYITTATQVTRPLAARLWNSETAAFYYSPNPLVNERFYLATYADVRNAVANGGISSGYYHFMQRGQYEGRNPSPLFNTQYYLAHNADVATYVATGAMTAFQHYMIFGAKGGRVASPFFDAVYYTNKYAGVKQGIQNGVFPSAAMHFAQIGIVQGYDPSALVNAWYYQAANPAVQTALANGYSRSALDHFFSLDQFPNLTTGHYLDLSPTPLFASADYLQLNPDLQVLVDNGRSLLRHFYYNNIGNNEMRVGTNQFDSNWYSQTYTGVSILGAVNDYIAHLQLFAQTRNIANLRNPNANFSESFYYSYYADVAGIMNRGVIDAGWEHFVALGNAEGRYQAPTT